MYPSGDNPVGYLAHVLGIRRNNPLGSVVGAENYNSIDELLNK